MPRMNKKTVQQLNAEQLERIRRVKYVLAALGDLIVGDLHASIMHDSPIGQREDAKLRTVRHVNHLYQFLTECSASALLEHRELLFASIDDWVLALNVELPGDSDKEEKEHV